jgi:formiminoglutamase
MSAPSSSLAEWWSALEPAPARLFHGRGDPEDPRLGEIVRRWDGGPCALAAGQAVLLGFPCDEGVRRNHGRRGAALAPDAIRDCLYRLTSWDPVTEVDLASLPVLDLGNLRIDADLAAAQERLGQVVAEVLKAGAVPIVLGGGHETAFGHYLGYVGAGLECAIINIDAHLDVRPYPHGPHSGSPFRQAIEHPTWPLKAGRYVVVGAQRQSVARAHWQFVHDHQGRVHWWESMSPDRQAVEVLDVELDRLGEDYGAILLTVDADAFRQADVPGTSAPSPFGLEGAVFPAIAFRAGSDPRVRSLDVVEINPVFDRDGQSARWAAVGIRQFLVGLAQRASR